jgi:protein-tyrosine-phosphatase
MEELGISIEAHRARQVDGAMIRDADLVLAMTPQHREALRREFGELGERIQTLPEYAEGDAAGGIADPYGYGLSVHRSSAREILRHLELTLERLEREG